MAEVRRHFLLNQLDVNELNRVFAQIADRMDQLEGYRDQGRFLKPPTSDLSATSGAEVVRKSQLDGEISDILSSLDNYHPFGGSTLIDLDADNIVTSEGLVVGGNAVIAGTTQSGNVLITPTGGVAVSMIAGEDLLEGHIVYVSQVGAADTVYKVPVNGDMPIGSVYADTALGDTVWIVCAGIAYILPETTVTASIGFVAAVSASESGRVQVRDSISGVTSHWREVGHFVESGTGNGLKTRAILHFN